jgi:hypothetical protein
MILCQPEDDYGRHMRRWGRHVDVTWYKHRINGGALAKWKMAANRFVLDIVNMASI